MLQSIKEQSSLGRASHRRCYPEGHPISTLQIGKAGHQQRRARPHLKPPPKLPLTSFKLGELQRLDGLDSLLHQADPPLIKMVMGLYRR